MKNVFIEKSCFLPLILSGQETYNKETYGLLIGKDAYRTIEGDKRRFALLEIGYPLQTAKRKPSESYLGNERAFRRVIKSLKAIGIDLNSGHGSSDMKIAGRYHSHTGDDSVSGIDADDIEGSIEMIEMIKTGGRRNGNYKDKDVWLELIMRSKRKSYEQNHEPNHSSRDYPNKIGNILRFGFEGYEITTSGFWITVHNCDVETVKTEEAILYAPWRTSWDLL